MSFLRRLYRIPAIILWMIAYGLRACVHRYFSKGTISIQQLAHLAHLWGKGLLVIFNFHLKVHGSTADFKKNGGLIVSNHQSYMDVQVHAAVFGSRFTPKVEIKYWPILGWYVGLSRPIWIDRKSKQASGKVMEECIWSIRNKIPIVVYPEGTTSDGKSGLLPFKTTFFEAIAQTSLPIQPMLTFYRTRNNDLHPAWYGDMTLLPHLWKLLGNQEVWVDVYVLPMFHPMGMTRKEIASRLHEIMQKEYDRIMKEELQEIA